MERKEYESRENEQLDIKLKATLSQVVEEFNRATKSANSFDGVITSIVSKVDKLGNVSKVTTLVQETATQVNKLKVTTNSAGEQIGTVFTQTAKKGTELKGTLASMFSANKLYLYWNLTKRLRTSLASVYNLAVDYIETQNKFNVSMGEAKDEATSFINRMSEAIGIAKAELMDYQTTYKNIISGLGNFTDIEAEKISESLTKMALDYSSMFNIGQQESMEKFQSALVGSIRPIRSDSGYDISDTTIGAKAKELGITRSTNKLNQVEKRLLRIIVLMEQLRTTGAMGDLARTIEQPANQMKVLKAQIQEVGVWLGNVFMGTVGKVLPYINAFVMTIKELIKMLAIFTGYTGDDTDLTDVFEAVEESTGGVSSNLGNASKSAKELRKTLMGFDVLNVINTPTSSKSGSASSGLGEVDPAILSALDDYESTMENVRMKATEIRDRIMEWLGYTKSIDPLTGEVSWKLKSGYQNIEKIKDVLIGIAGLVVVKKGIKWITSIVSLFKKGITALTSSKLVVWFTNLSNAIKGAVAGSASAQSALTFMLTPIVKITSVLSGLVLAIKGATDITNEYNKILEGQAISQENVVKGMAEMTAGGALVGAVFGPWGALIGGIVGALGGLVVGLVQTEKILTEIARGEIFGSLSVSTQSWIDQLERLNTFEGNTVVEELQSKVASLSEEFDKASATVEGYGIRFGLMGEKLKNEDVEEIKSAVSDMCQSTTSMIEANGDAQIKLWANTFDTLGNISKEEQKEWLNNIKNYGTEQKEEISQAQENITKTYENAIKTRGYLTDEEYEYIQTQLQKIRELTQSNMSQSNTDMLYLKSQFINDYTKLDEQSYKNFKEAQEKYREEQLEAISQDYNAQYNYLNSMLEDKVLSQEDYNKKIEQLNEQRAKNEEKINQTIEEATHDVFNALVEQYDEVKNKNDETSKHIKSELEKLFEDLDIDPNNFVTEMEKSGREARQALFEELQKNKLDPTSLIGSDKTWATRGANASTAFWNNWKNGRVSVSTTEDGGARLKVNPYADGGMPSVGELFMAREAGPELVGKIGNSNAVMNNQQIVQAVSQGVASAVASVMGNMRNGDVRVLVDGREITSIVEERMLRNQNIYGTA